MIGSRIFRVAGDPIAATSYANSSVYWPHIKRTLSKHRLLQLQTINEYRLHNPREPQETFLEALGVQDTGAATRKATWGDSATALSGLAAERVNDYTDGCAAFLLLRSLLERLTTPL
ncbi:hypothetical protein BAUCODRAFT_462553 [Baudoinia panamericana UAMH 10762]|uniref:Uncharacterized protein n=1 Tax=Baudoinia panamericana (strain UAMH 10762) TaxID=717646 RepID=M2LT23_BAUPA|nr:uncharacterized protein BAUCODRAFT_462553 [Baudoinia panamericana UAMH 10762]EMC97662.1 hypothetical protein BAUCODRAFT_462553 [Baudoinia panamericana UAMH 10762]